MGLFYSFIFIFIFFNMKPLSVEMACVLGIQNEIQAVCSGMPIETAMLSMRPACTGTYTFRRGNLELPIWNTVISSTQIFIWWLFFQESGGEIQWIGDTFCDDVSNKKACDFDGGDCCGNDVYSNFCTNCTCIGGCKLILEFHLNVRTGGAVREQPQMANFSLTNRPVVG